MARLGSVLGAILADLMRARLAADELSKELAGEYSQDSVLSSMSVPRVVVEEAALTLRFSVSELQEVEGTTPDATKVRTAWARHAGAKVVPRTLARLGVQPAERVAAGEAIEKAAGAPIGEPTLREVRSAIAGNSEPLVASSAEPVLDVWSKLPAEVRTEVGGKAVFRRELEQNIREEFNVFLERQRELELVRGALASRVEVAVRPEDLPSDPGLIQEFRITARGQDMDVLINEIEDAEADR